MADRKSNRNSDKFLGTLMNSIPYAQTIYNTIQRGNPRYKAFDNLPDNNLAAINKNSVFRDSAGALGDVITDKGFGNYLYAKIDENKIRRIQDYRRMAAFAELSDAIDEICDEAISEDQNGKVIDIISIDSSLSENAQKELRTEWKKFIELFDLSNKGFDYFRQFLIDGELYFENVIEEGREENGIRAVLLLPPELIDPVYGNRQNDYIDKFTLRKPVYDQSAQHKEEVIVLDSNQVTYVNSGIWNEDRTIRLPYIENSRRAYKQLTLIEDSIVIYRIVRAPERLVFKVDVGNMSAPNAEAYLKRLMQQYWSRRTFSSQDGQVVNSYEPQSMLDAYWFPKRGDSEGVTVDQLQGGANLGELSDLNYFLQKLYKTLKVPVSRLSAESTVSANDEETTREELRFAKFVMRVQRQVAQGIKNGFVVHLKLKGLWDQYKLRSSSLEVQFSTPTNFQVMRNQQIFGLQSANFNDLASNESISASYAQRHYLKMSDDQMKENRAWLRKDAEFRWELLQIESNGPDWREKDAESMDIDPGMPGGAPAGGGAGGRDSLPDFGPTPEPEDADIGEAPEPAP